MIQIDMPMPENCHDCPACNEYLICTIPVNGRGWGKNDVREFGQGRPEWCPMKEQEEVEPKTWHWIYKDTVYDYMFMCSCCGKHSIRNDYPYCHWCGAKMKAGEWNEQNELR